MNIYGLVGFGVAMALAPLGRKVTARWRRWAIVHLKDGRFKRLMLTPLGYTKSARDAAAAEAAAEDCALLGERARQSWKRQSR